MKANKDYLLKLIGLIDAEINRSNNVVMKELEAGNYSYSADVLHRYLNDNILLENYRQTLLRQLGDTDDKQ